MALFNNPTDLHDVTLAPVNPAEGQVISFSGCSGNQLRNVTVRGGKYAMILIAPTTGIVVDGFTTEGQSDYGIYLEGGVHTGGKVNTGATFKRLAFNVNNGMHCIRQYGSEGTKIEDSLLVNTGPYNGSPFNNRQSKGGRYNRNTFLGHAIIMGPDPTSAEEKSNWVEDEEFNDCTFDNDQFIIFCGRTRKVTFNRCLFKNRSGLEVFKNYGNDVVKEITFNDCAILGGNKLINGEASPFKFSNCTRDGKAV